MAVTLSIVMPVYNHRELVVKMWDSIRQNDFQDWELLAIDDGSDEEDFTFLSDYAQRDSRIFYTKRNLQPKGAQTCRNMGMESAQGKYIIFFDSDDWIVPTCLSCRVTALEKRPDLDFMVFPSGTIENDIYNEGAHMQAFGYHIYDDDYEAFACRMMPFIVWNNIYRTDALRKAGVFWDTNLLSLQDADFNLKTMFAGLKYDYSPVAKPDMGYRLKATENSISAKVPSKEHRQSVLYAIENYYKMYQAHKGHAYDVALYIGVLYLYNMTMREGLDEQVADEMVKIVGRYSSNGADLERRVRWTKRLQTFMPQKRARQIPMMGFLLCHLNRMKRKVRKMKKLIVAQGNKMAV